MENSPFSSLAVAVTIASTHCAYPWSDGQAKLVELLMPIQLLLLNMWLVYFTYLAIKVKYGIVEFNIPLDTVTKVRKLTIE